METCLEDLLIMPFLKRKIARICCINIRNAKPPIYNNCILTKNRRSGTIWGNTYKLAIPHLWQRHRISSTLSRTFKHLHLTAKETVRIKLKLYVQPANTIWKLLTNATIMIHMKGDSNIWEIILTGKFSMLELDRSLKGFNGADHVWSSVICISHTAIETLKCLKRHPPLVAKGRVTTA